LPHAQGLIRGEVFEPAFERRLSLLECSCSRKEPPEFVVITGGSEADCDYTDANYQRFFGREIKKQDNFFPEGLSDKAIRAAHK
jgi:hypothetical protein